MLTISKKLKLFVLRVVLCCLEDKRILVLVYTCDYPPVFWLKHLPLSWRSNANLKELCAIIKLIRDQILQLQI